MHLRRTQVGGGVLADEVVVCGCAVGRVLIAPFSRVCGRYSSTMNVRRRRIAGYTWARSAAAPSAANAVRVSGGMPIPSRVNGSYSGLRVTSSGNWPSICAGTCCIDARAATHPIAMPSRRRAMT
jgi:hypothetical protein